MSLDNENNCLKCRFILFKNTCLQLCFVGILTETLGWVYAFYVPAAITAVITLAWFALVYDSPAQHPRIEKTEREYIESVLGGNMSKKKVNGD